MLVLRSEILSGMCAKLRTVAASNFRDHPTRSLYYCLFAPRIYIFVLRAHPVRGESHNQRNTTGEVATTSPPFYNERHRSHVLLCEGWTRHYLQILVRAPFCCNRKSRAACAQSFAPWQQATIEIMRRNLSLRAVVVMFNRWHANIRRASTPQSLLLLLALATHIYLWSSRTCRSWWIKKSTQNHRRVCNAGFPKRYEWGRLVLVCEHCSNSRLKLPDILSCHAEARRLAHTSLIVRFTDFLVHNICLQKGFWLAAAEIAFTMARQQKQLTWHMC